MATKTQFEDGYHWLGYAEAAAYLGVTERQMRRAAQEGKVEFTRLGLRVLFSKQQLDRFVERSTARVAS